MVALALLLTLSQARQTQETVFDRNDVLRLSLAHAQSFVAVVEPVGVQFESSRKKKSDGEVVRTREQRVTVLGGHGVDEKSTLTIVCSPPGSVYSPTELAVGRIYLLLGIHGDGESLWPYPGGEKVVGSATDVHPVRGIPITRSKIVIGASLIETTARTLMAQLPGATREETLRYLNEMPVLPLGRRRLSQLGDLKGEELQRLISLVYHEPDATCEALAELAMKSPLRQRLLIQNKLLSEHIRGSQPPVVKTVTALKEEVFETSIDLTTLWFNRTATKPEDRREFTPDSVEMLELMEQCLNYAIRRWAAAYVHRLTSYEQKRRYAQFLTDFDPIMQERIVNNLSRMEGDSEHRVRGGLSREEHTAASRRMAEYWKEKFNIER